MRSFSPCAVLLAAAAWSTFAIDSLASTAGAVPVGYLTYPVTTGATISFGVPLTALPAFAGKAAAVTANTISAADVSWTANQFASGAVPYFVLIKSGPQAGRALLVSGNTENTVTVATDGTGLQAAGFAVTAGVDSFALVQGETLGTLLGTAADANGFLASGIKAGAESSSADLVKVYDGSNYVAYFFSLTAGTWVQADDGVASQNNLMLYLEEGLLITRRGPDGVLTRLGQVPSTQLLTKLTGGTTNVVSVRFPADTTLGGLNFGAPGSWLTGASAAEADTISLWDGANWQAYYQNLSGVWVKESDAADQGGLTIRVGSAIRVGKSGSADGAGSFFGQARPY